MSVKSKKVKVSEVTWPFVVLAVCLDMLFVAAYIMTAMTEQMFYTLITAKFAFLAGVVGAGWYAARKAGE
jgi:hypothetical protein